MASNNPNGPPSGNPSGDESYNKTLMYTGLAAAGIYIVYKLFSTLKSIGVGGGGTGGNTTPTCSTSAPGAIVKLRVSRSKIGDALAAWLSSTPGWATFLANNPSFGSRETLSANGYDRTQWTFEYDTPYYFLGWYFYPTVNATISYGFPVNMAFGGLFIYVETPDGCLLGMASTNPNLYGKKYINQKFMPVPPGLTPPSNTINPWAETQYLFMGCEFGLKSWRMTQNKSCPGFVLNADHGTNVLWST